MQIKVFIGGEMKAYKSSLSQNNWCLTNHKHTHKLNDPLNERNYC